MKFKFHAVVFIAGCISSCTTLPEKIEQPDTPLLGDGLGINGATIVVQDLDSARNYYKNVLGFKMPEKFENGIYDGTLVAYVGFADFSSIELLSVKDTPLVESKSSFITSFAKHHEGVRLYSLSTSSVDTTMKWLNSQGYKIDTPRSGRTTTEISKEWDWDDGGPQWRNVAFNANNPPPDLPTFMEVAGLPYKEIQSEWKPYSWRKWYGEHANGVVGISFCISS